MCLVTKNPEIKTVDKDITVYKFSAFNSELDSDCFYPHYYCNFKYLKDVATENIDLIPIKRGDFYEVDRGYHAYFSINHIYPIRKNFYKRFCIGKFVIPKGAKYITGMCNEIVASKMIFNGIESKPYIDFNVFEKIVLFLKFTLCA